MTGDASVMAALRRFRRRSVPILPLLRRSGAIVSFIHRERVRFGDLDAMRHLNNVVFLRYFETARIAYLRELVPAHDPAHPEDDDFGVIFAECHINYRSPVVFDEEVEVRCTAADVRRSSFRVAFEMWVGERLAAEGYGVLVGFDYVAQRAMPLPGLLRERLAAEAA
jgi:acyl-CoA thioester hydrolase